MTEIDDSLFNRQRYVLGDQAMQAMAKSRVFLSGLGGLGAEIAKNIALAGVGTLTLHDPTPVKDVDFELQFFLSSSGQGTRAEASQAAIAELNPYVRVNTVSSLDSLDFLRDYQVVILTEAPLATRLRVDEFCRSVGTHFICSDIKGAFGMVFCDFGDAFTVFDTTGEVEAEVILSVITNDGICVTLEGHKHRFNEDDVVEFSEVVGCDGINGKQYKIHVIDPFRFSIGDISGFKPYVRGGIAHQMKVPDLVRFSSLADSLPDPSIIPMDFTFPNRPEQLHIGFRALDLFESSQGRSPAPWSKRDAESMLALCNQVSNGAELDVDLLRKLSFTASGCLGALAATIGGVVSQEALKAVSGKFSPLHQFLYADAADSVPDWSPNHMTSPPSKRGDMHAICLGQDVVSRLADLRVFMIGAGAIGCEMLKNLSVMGVACGDGKVVVTDHDNIEMSNLNRQFLFRRQDIQNPKSSAAVNAVCRMQPRFRAQAMLHKVEQATESVFTDEFFVSQDVVINALDNVEARQYVDGRCVTNQRPLLESGTMGTKGHVQVILPFLTESYTSQSDPEQSDVPYCTIKNFPAKIEHTITWARDKFESLFTLKPTEAVKFLEENGCDSVAQMSDVSGLYRVFKVMTRLPHSFDDCVAFARQKFEKMFNHSILQLLHAFPLDMKLSDGTPYWTLPKRPPAPITFNVDDPLHMTFVEAAACLRAVSFAIPIPDDVHQAIVDALHAVSVPEFQLDGSKKIEDDESKTREEMDAKTGKNVDRDEFVTSLRGIGPEYSILPTQFEKDDDSNHHIELITAAANLRARNYGIVETDRINVKLIAGRIIPAIATTTSVVSGLVTLELIKIVRKAQIEDFRNAFVNLALPIFAPSEPGSAKKQKIRDDVVFTLWDRWDVKGLGGAATLSDFIKYFKDVNGLEVDSVFKGKAAVYMPAFPGHIRRLKKKMSDLLKHKSARQPYYDLTVLYNDGAGGSVDGPRVRYYM